MILKLVNVIYLLVAISMVALILLQRGAGASAGSGFGGGASSTVFGARGSANFLSSATKWLAVVFFALSLGMAWNASRSVRQAPVTEDIGVMGELPAAPAVSTPATESAPAAPVIQPAAAPALEAPAVEAPALEEQKPAEETPAKGAAEG